MVMPRLDDCDHPNCDGGPCKALTATELTPGPEDRALAEELVAGGWIQVSAKYRTLLRWRVPPPTVDELVRPEYRDSHFARQLKQHSNLFLGEHAMRMAPRDMTERRTLSPREFKAFKALKNKPWRDWLARNQNKEV